MGQPLLLFGCGYQDGSFTFGFRIMATTSTTKPAIIRMGASVILLKLYISASLNTCGSELFPPAMSRKPSRISARPANMI